MSVPARPFRAQIADLKNLSRENLPDGVFLRFMEAKLRSPQPPILAISAKVTRKGRLSRFGDHFAEIGCCASRV
jgi:hypothetical protein